jgi:hypothetical protein
MILFNYINFIIKLSIAKIKNISVPNRGIEPLTNRLRVDHSTTELIQRATLANLDSQNRI